VKELSAASNWATQVPRHEHPIVTLRDTQADVGLLAHPLADLQITQRVLPLEQEIARFGNATPAGERYFTLSAELDSPVAGTPTPTGAPVEDYFAPAQFRDMSDDEKLMAPAFERMRSGMRFSTRAYVCGAAIEEDEVMYERKTVWGPRPTPAAALAAEPAALEARPAPIVLPAGFVERVAASGAAGRAPIAASGISRFRGPGEGVKLEAPTYAVVVGRGVDAVRVTPGPGSDGEGFATAASTLDARLGAHPEERGRLRIVPVIEMPVA